MALKVAKIDIWSGEIRDQVGGLAAAIEPLVKSGANFTFLIGRRQPNAPGRGMIFLGGLRGAKQTKAAAAAGLSQSADLAGLRVESPDKPGLLHQVVSKVAGAGISLRGVSASVIGTRCAIVLAFDSAPDRDKAATLLAK